MLCREKARKLGVEDYLTYRGTVNVRELLGEFDILVLSSYNEGQTIVALEAMTAGLPIVSREVGGMAQLIGDPLTTSGGRTWGPCGLLVQPVMAGQPDELVPALLELMNDPETYATMAFNARGRILSFFQLEDAMGPYNRLYKELADISGSTLESDSFPVDPTASRRRVAGGVHRLGRRRKELGE